MNNLICTRKVDFVYISQKYAQKSAKNRHKGDFMMKPNTSSENMNRLSKKDLLKLLDVQMAIISSAPDNLLHSPVDYQSMLGLMKLIVEILKAEDK